jgi:hypothetical protein
MPVTGRATVTPVLWKLWTFDTSSASHYTGAQLKDREAWVLGLIDLSSSTFRVMDPGHVLYRARYPPQVMGIEKLVRAFGSREPSAALGIGMCQTWGTGTSA